MLEEQLAVRPRSSHLRLECSGGQTLQGQLVRYQARSRTLLLAHQDTLSWVDLNQVVALTLVEVEPWLEELTRGQVRQSGQPAPTRLQLRREVEQLRQALGLQLIEVPWLQIPEDDQSAGHLALLLNEIASAWREISGDQLGREALEPIREIVLEPAALAGLILHQGRCRIQIAIEPEGMLAFPAGSLKKLLEKAL